MKLSKSEIKVVLNLKNRLIYRKYLIVFMLLILVCYWILVRVQFILELEASFTLFIFTQALLVFYLGRKEDEIADLLERYINHDKEAIQALSEQEK